MEVDIGTVSGIGFGVEPILVIHEMSAVIGGLRKEEDCGDNQRRLCRDQNVRRVRMSATQPLMMPHIEEPVARQTA